MAHALLENKQRISGRTLTFNASSLDDYHIFMQHLIAWMKLNGRSPSAFGRHDFVWLVWWTIQVYILLKLIQLQPGQNQVVKKLSEPRHFLMRLVKLKFPCDIHFLCNKEFHAKFCTEHEPGKLSRTWSDDPLTRKFKRTQLLMGGSAVPNAPALGSLPKHIFVYTNKPWARQYSVQDDLD